MVQHSMMAEWRSASTMLGAQSVTLGLIDWMLVLSANSWDFHSLVSISLY